MTIREGSRGRGGHGCGRSGQRSLQDRDQVRRPHDAREFFRRCFPPFLFSPRRRVKWHYASRVKEAFPSYRWASCQAAARRKAPAGAAASLHKPAASAYSFGVPKSMDVFRLLKVASEKSPAVAANQKLRRLALETSLELSLSPPSAKGLARCLVPSPLEHRRRSRDECFASGGGQPNIISAYTSISKRDSDVQRV